MTADYKPEGWPTVAPRLVTADAPGLVGFLRHVFGAQGELTPGRPAEMRIGDSILLVSDGGGLREASAGFLHVYVEDADATYRRAMERGAQAVEPPGETPYGDRRATVRDPWGNLWQIATHRRG